MMETLVSAGRGRSLTLGIVGVLRIKGARGLMGVTGREWLRYQAKTVWWGRLLVGGGGVEMMEAERTFVTVFCRVSGGADDRVEGGAEEGGYCGFHCCGSRGS